MLKGGSSAVLRQAMMVLLALALLGGLVPAAPVFGMESAAAAGEDCCSPAVLPICQPSTAFVADELQTGSSPAGAVHVGWRDALVSPTPPGVVKPHGALVTGGPPAYLLFHRLLL